MPDANGGYEEVVERERQSFLTFIFKTRSFLSRFTHAAGEWKALEHILANLDRC